MVNKIILNDVLGNIIVAGMILAYLFQYIKIIKAKTSKGINHIFLAIGYVGSLCSLANSIIFYYSGWFDCIGFAECDSNILGFIQLFVQSLCFMIFYILFIIYYDNESVILRYISYKYIVIFIFISLTLLLLGANIASLLLIRHDYNIISSHSSHDIIQSSVKKYADALSIIVIIATCTQYIPQIIQTCKDKYPGSLSLITILIQCPGSFIIATFLALQHDADLSTWIPYAVTGLLQLILLIIGTIFYHKYKYDHEMNHYHPIIVN